MASRRPPVWITVSATKDERSVQSLPCAIYSRLGPCAVDIEHFECGSRRDERQQGPQQVAAVEARGRASGRGEADMNECVGRHGMARTLGRLT
jgi:hypothetical protein